MAGEGEAVQNLITVLVRSPKEKKDISLNGSSTIKQLKAICAREFVAAVDQLCVIYAGKILSNDDILDENSVRDGSTLHLVVKSAHHVGDELPARIAESTVAGVSGKADVSATPFGLGGLGGLNGLNNLGMGSANFMDLQQKMMREMIGNPEMMSSLLDSPFVRNMMSNTEMMGRLMALNPQLQEVMEKNPEISQTMSDPELMRRMVDVIRSPAMLQELMRGQEHFISGLRIPASASKEQTSKSDGSDADKPEASEPEPAPPTELFNADAARSMILQVSQNPQLMTNMLQAPYVQTMLQSMSENQDLVQQMLMSSPVFANNETLKQQLPQVVPYFAQQLQNPEIHSLLSNPRALQAMLLVQQGMQELNAATPYAFNTGSPSSTGETPSASDQYTQYMSQMLNMVTPSDSGATSLPEQQFALQLHQLSVMGFGNREDNIKALSAAEGDVNSAALKLLQQH